MYTWKEEAKGITVKIVVIVVIISYLVVPLLLLLLGNVS